MRTTKEIIEDVRHGEKPEYDELFYTVRAIEAVWCIDGRAVLKLWQMADKSEPIGKIKIVADLLWKEQQRRWKNLGEKDPKSYLGPNYDPRDPAVQDRIKLAEKVIDKLSGT